MATQDVSEGLVLDRTHRGGSIARVLLVALLLVAAAIAFLLIGRSRAEPYILGLLAVLAMIGVFSLFAGAAGILLLSGKEAANPVIKSLVDGAVGGIVVTDAAGRVVYANTAYLELIGARRPEQARPVERAFTGDPDLSEAVYRLVKASREGRRLQEEVRVAGQGAEPARWLRMRVRPLASRRLARASVWTVADITRERERQENTFQELQHAIDYLDHAPAGFFSVEPGGAVVYLNATLAGWLDYDLAQVGSGGLKLADIVSGEGAALITTMTGTPGDVKTEALDLDLRTRSGRTLPVRIYHKVAFAADGSRGASRTLVLNRAREESADPLRAAQLRFVRFFHHTPLAIATIDKGGRIARTNGLFARLFGGTNGETAQAEARSIMAVVAERHRTALETALKRAADGQVDIPSIDAVLAEDDSRSARFWVTAIEEEERDGEAAIVYAIDTTEQRKLEQQLGKSQKMEAVAQLAGGMAHDFNNVLSAIMMATDFLLNAHRPTDPSFQDIMQIKQNANRAASLVRQLLAFSRRQTMRPQVLNLSDVLRDLNMLLRRLIGDKVDLEPRLGVDLWPVKADIAQLEQVIVNLAVNARDAMPDGGRLVVRSANITAAECGRYAYKAMPAADYVLIEVADNGTGIAPDIVDKVYEPFFSTKEVGKGTGLGLSMVYGIVKQTGGFIFFDSELGKGTTFRIFLPRHVPGAAEVAAEAAEAEAARVTALDAAQRPADLTGQGTILLVEDEDGLRGLNARGLASRGYTVIEAANGAEALEMFDRHGGEIDLVVSDVVMPEMDGPTLLKELRKRKPGTKIILVSGYAEDAFDKSLAEGERFSFLPKPFTLKQLIKEVKETMAG